MMPYMRASCFAWALALAITIPLQLHFMWGRTSHFAGVWIIVTFLFAFFSWDAWKIENRLGPEGYLQA